MLANAAKVFLSLMLIPLAAGAHIDRARVHQHNLVGRREANATTSLERRQSYDNAKFTWYTVGL